METILTWTYAVLEITPARWRELMAKLPSELLTRPPAAGEWSALDCLQHLVDAERWVFPARVNAILAGQNFPAFDPDSTGEKSDTRQSPTALVEEFSRLRADSLTLLKKLTVDDLNRQARHQELGVVTMSELIHEWGGHDLMHTVQAERALMQPFIQGSGRACLAIISWKPHKEVRRQNSRYLLKIMVLWSLITISSALQEIIYDIV